MRAWQIAPRVAHHIASRNLSNRAPYCIARLIAHFIAPPKAPCFAYGVNSGPTPHSGRPSSLLSLSLSLSVSVSLSLCLSLSRLHGSFRCHGAALAPFHFCRQRQTPAGARGDAALRRPALLGLEPAHTLSRRPPTTGPLPGPRSSSAADRAGRAVFSLTLAGRGRESRYPQSRPSHGSRRDRTAPPEPFTAARARSAPPSRCAVRLSCQPTCTAGAGSRGHRLTLRCLRKAECHNPSVLLAEALAGSNPECIGAGSFKDLHSRGRRSDSSLVFLLSWVIFRYARASKRAYASVDAARHHSPSQFHAPCKRP